MTCFNVVAPINFHQWTHKLNMSFQQTTTLIFSMLTLNNINYALLLQISEVKQQQQNMACQRYKNCKDVTCWMDYTCSKYEYKYMFNFFKYILFFYLIFENLDCFFTLFSLYICHEMVASFKSKLHCIEENNGMKILRFGWFIRKNVCIVWI